MLGGLIESRNRSRTPVVWQGALLAVLFLACCWIRLYDLGWKSIMHDEALFVYYTHYQLYDSWTYQYLPILHGPAMLHIQALIFHLFGASDYTMRLGCALLGVGGFFWVASFRPWMGRTGMLVALAFYTVSPGIVFYQRFFRNDSLYLFTSLWIVASLAHWWRSGRPAWLASAIVGITVLFTNKESSLFLYFSLLTFAVLMVLADVCQHVFRGQSREIVSSLPHVRFPGPLVPALVCGGIIVLILTQVFEGITYDQDVRDAIGHDWVLRDVRSIPLALGWTQLGAGAAPDAGAARFGGFWRTFYLALFAGLFAGFAAIGFFVEHRIGRKAFLADFWCRLYRARWHIGAALFLGVFLYLWIFTTGFVKDAGLFEIYADTWAYWGGQHEWGRIGGPFHQHMLNMLIYETPSVLIVLGAWIGGLFVFRASRYTGVTFVLMIVALAAFHKLLFSGLEIEPPGASGLVPLQVSYLKLAIVTGIGLVAALVLLPRSGRVLIPAAFFLFIPYSIVYLQNIGWRKVLYEPLYRDGNPVMLSNQHVDLYRYMEIQFNFDGGTSLAIVVGLIFFVTLYTWHELGRGRRFRAFLLWWFLTATGAASYAREAVPQVGIHAMLPLILLAGSYVQDVLDRLSGSVGKRFVYACVGMLLVWNLKTTVNLNFYNADDPRERIIYGPTPRDLVNHCNFVLKYNEIASARTDGSALAWYTHNNEPAQQKITRVGVTSDPVVWPVRWYLRDIQWDEHFPAMGEAKSPMKFVDQNYEFLFIEEKHLRDHPVISEKYHTFVGSAIRFYQPRPLDRKRLTDIWKMQIPGHYLDGSPQAGEAWNAREEWKKIWRYMILRETFDGGAPGAGNVNGTQYVFCVRKDLY